jgi:hypothetical protein
MPSAVGSSVGSTLLSAKKLCGRLPGGGATKIVRLMVVVGAKVPEVPVMVIVPLPVAAEELAVNVSVLFNTVLAGLNEAVTPVGNPEAARFTLPEKPFAGTTLIVTEPLAACCKVTAPGDDESENDGGGA